MKINVTQSNKIIKIHSFVYNQLMSGKYCLMQQNAWFIWNYAYTNLFRFKNVEHISFDLAMNTAIGSLTN